MTTDAPGQTLLDELDVRQDELLDELDRLNTRIEQVIAQFTKHQITSTKLQTNSN